MDKALRKLELQAKCGGDPSAFLGALARISPAALLKGRVELGLTTESQLACAAFLGHEVARKVEGYTIRFEDHLKEPRFCSRAVLEVIEKLPARKPKRYYEIVILEAVVREWWTSTWRLWDVCCGGTDCTCGGLPIDPEWHEVRAVLKMTTTWINAPFPFPAPSLMYTHPLENRAILYDTPVFRLLTFAEHGAPACFYICLERAANQTGGEIDIRATVLEAILPYLALEAADD